MAVINLTRDNYEAEVTEFKGTDPADICAP